jgi:hypothetical protein
MTAKTLMETAPVDWEKAVDKIPTRQRDELRRQLEGIAERAPSWPAIWMSVTAMAAATRDTRRPSTRRTETAR